MTHRSPIWRIAWSLVAIAIAVGVIWTYPESWLAITGGICLAVVIVLFVANDWSPEVISLTKDGLELRNTIREAGIAIERMRAMAKIVGYLALSQSVRSGRFGGFTDQEMEKQSEEVSEILTELGATTKDLHDVKAEIYRFAKFDYTRGFFGNDTSEKNSDCLSEYKAFIARSIFNIPTSAELRAYKAKYKMCKDGEDMDEWLNDYEYYEQHLTHRRPTEWARRQAIQMKVLREGEAQREKPAAMPERKS